MEHEGDSDTNCCLCSWDNPQRIDEGTGRLGNTRISRDHPDYNLFMIKQNTGKSPGDLRRLVVTQTPVEDHQLTLMWKTHKEVNNNNNNNNNNNLF